MDPKAESSRGKPRSGKLFQDVCLVRMIAIFVHSKMFIDFVPGTVQGSGNKNEKEVKFLASNCSQRCRHIFKQLPCSAISAVFKRHVNTLHIGIIIWPYITSTSHLLIKES